MGHRPAHEIDEDTAELRLIAFTQFQMCRHHQRHQVIFIVFQPPAGGQNR
jgi:hypothetical protein